MSPDVICMLIDMGILMAPIIAIIAVINYLKNHRR